MCTAGLTACSHSGATSPIPSQEVTNLVAPESYKVVYSFGSHGNFDDGRAPVGGVGTVGGDLYGTTQYGGTTNSSCDLGCGTVFALSISGKEHILYRFTGGNDGEEPAAALARVGATLFGTTSSGGATTECSTGCGTVFAVSTDGKTKRILYRFKGGSDGATPVASLMLFKGTLYGTTEFGGYRTRICSSGCGTVFKVTTNGAESVIYRFKGETDGAEPVARLIALGSALYGTTQYGGAMTSFCARGCGTLFRLTTAGVKKIVHAFKYGPGSHDGAYPGAAPTLLRDELYGTTVGGGGMGEGTVFKVNPATGAESVVHTFTCCSTQTDGEFPSGRLLSRGGVLYGTTRQGGTYNRGIVFRLASGTETALHEFSGKPDGAQPQAGPILLGGKLYGTTAAGGSTGAGTVFALTP